MKRFSGQMCFIAIFAALVIYLASASTAAELTVGSNVNAKLYGYIKLDTAYNDSMTGYANYLKWVQSEGINENDNEFIMTANETRFGLDFSEAESGNLKTSGKIEGEFFSGLGSENKAAFAMRHAYVQIDWPGCGTSLLMGQTWDVISPLNPATIIYHVYWWAGNVGYRHPQIRFTKKAGAAEIKIAASRTVGSANAFASGDTGVDSGQPTLQGRVAVSGKILTDKNTTLGVSGHAGSEEYDTSADGTNLSFKSSSLNVDLTIPLAPKLALKGEAFSGENMDDYLGGIGQGVNANLLKEIKTSGAWACVSIGPMGRSTCNIGFTSESVDEDCLNAGNKSGNSVIFANIIWDVTKALMLAAEVSSWTTKYVGMDDGKAARGHFAAKYKF
ncbi:MAG: hypothetical protein JW803_02775 [Endomicrobiales bacterium]|nr:hypothetical protein [Endomicrobiales bacterium]